MVVVVGQEERRAAPGAASSWNNMRKIQQTETFPFHSTL
jgi:hypothetical protein